MERQLFVNELQLSFNLRKPKGNKPTGIYLVCRIDGKQVKLSTGVKVYPEHWNKNRQEAYISLRLSELDNRNNQIVNERISKLKLDFFEFKKYLCGNTHNIENCLDILKSYIYKSDYSMRKDKQRVNASIEMLQIVESKDVKESTKEIQLGIVQLFAKFLKESNIPDTWNSINLETLNKYQQYLIANGKVFQTIKNNFGVINSILKIANKRQDIPFKILESGTDSFDLIRNKANKEKQKDKQIALTEEQVERIYKHTPTGKNAEKVTEIKDIFVLQCLTGQRFSDMDKFFCGDYKTDGDIISIVQKKTNKIATIPLLPLAQEILAKYPNGTKYVTFKRSDNTISNKELKKIAKEIGFTDTVSYHVQRGKEVEIIEEPLYELIHTHSARHTFITICCMRDIPKDIVIIATGHSDTKLIDEVYSHLSDKSKGEKISKAFNDKLKGAGVFSASKKDITSKITEQINKHSENGEISPENIYKITSMVINIVSFLVKDEDKDTAIKTAIDMSLSMLKKEVPMETIVDVVISSFKKSNNIPDIIVNDKESTS
ncbi:integrase [Parabacteroides sp. PF5-5]|uniref:tyrosine-type recombinase/integrase n=1 Tax=unclassified Parabacteroides TaxID=2649774 RepID=UPI00247653B3|nr:MULTISPECIES: tyrosine-type recombinase/integrase [unclassified Parabacteroides]MDH6306266.1 integrase [Parabacteroides sp. PH5-39]MDH6316943.1 integrase [Parabacteroides sp. PF5-13]MDH6321012.1 integrase [Parabacteroides sp. PH5-13]MDH6324744.1 integrase [Parabacteroides sp. PH5-8]MDH6328128.1 integrase [Parabacteroides sp. PH5-41]